MIKYQINIGGRSKMAIIETPIQINIGNIVCIDGKKYTVFGLNGKGSYVILEVS